jgi:PhnB protein
MSTINSLLIFNGNCREAMTFYKKCLGGTLTFQTVGESSLSEPMSKKMKDCILSCTLQNGSLLLMGSDMVPEEGLIKGNAVSLTLTCGSEIEIRNNYKKLSAGGLAREPLKYNYHGVLFGGLIDKYGNTWLLNYHKP